MKADACDAACSMDREDFRPSEANRRVPIHSYNRRHVAVEPTLDMKVSRGRRPFLQTQFAVTGLAKCQIADQ
jgi:hypothetical protein